MQEILIPPPISFGRSFRSLEEELYPQIISKDDDDTQIYVSPESETKFYLDLGHDSFLMAGTYSLVPSTSHTPLPPPPSLSLSNEIYVTGPTSAVVLIYGPFFQDRVRKTLRRMDEECLKTSGKTIDLSIEITDDCDITVGRAIMGELISIVRRSIGRAHLVVPRNPIGANALDNLMATASFETPSLHCLSWKGDVKYLPSPWYSLCNLPFSQFTGIVLECNISIDDCTEILSRCDGIVDFRVNSSGGCKSVMKHTFPQQTGRSGMKVMDRLRSLVVSSTDSCRSLTDKFHFTALKYMDISTGVHMDENDDNRSRRMNGVPVRQQQQWSFPGGAFAHL